MPRPLPSEEREHVSIFLHDELLDGGGVFDYLTPLKPLFHNATLPFVAFNT